MFDHWGREMTTAKGTCTNCGARAMLAELRVYMRAPAAVARCPRCGAVLMVLATRADTARVYMGSLRLD